MLISHQNRSRLDSLAEDAFCLSLFQFPHLLPYSFLRVKDTYKQPVLFDAFYFTHRDTPDNCSLPFSGQARCNQPLSCICWIHMWIISSPSFKPPVQSYQVQFIRKFQNHLIFHIPYPKTEATMRTTNSRPHMPTRVPTDQQPLTRIYPWHHISQHGQ